jgi:alkaline phosphatase D
VTEERGHVENDVLPAARWSRRRFLTATGAATALAFATRLPLAGRARAQALPGYPFTLGVASGDPLPDSVVVWTRLAPAPLEPFGGLEPRIYPVRWEVAADDRFRRVVRRGATVARPEYAHSVHVDVRGLQPGREYFYRFEADGELSPLGRTKTAPAAGAALSALRFAFASCQAYPDGYYTAYRHMADEDLDLVVHLGDYLYEYGLRTFGGARGQDLPARYDRETVTLDDYRGRYALYKSDLDLQAAHAAFPWIVAFDDHEVENNWADEVSENNEPPAEFLVRRANAFRAYWEHMPLRLPVPDGVDIPLYRRLRFGDLAELNVLDTRQYRSDQACGDGRDAGCAARLDASRTITGAEQERWLLDGLGRSRARWNVLAQQVFFSQIDYGAGARLYNMDGWDGYKASRDRVIAGLVERRVRNPVVLTGDVHANYASDVKADFDDPESPTLGVEFVGTSISSAGDGSDTRPSGELELQWNPHLKFFNFQRGYVRCTLTEQQWRADYRLVPYVSRPGAQVYTRASFVTDDGSPGLRQVADAAVRGDRFSTAGRTEPELDATRAQRHDER